MKNSEFRYTGWHTLITLILLCVSNLAIAQENNSLEKQKIIVKRLIEEGYNQRNFNVIDSLVAIDYIEYTNGVRSDSSSAIKKTINWLMSRAPDFKITPVFVMAEGDMVALQWVYTGKNVKYNKDVKLHGIYIARFKDKLITEGWQYFDNQQRYEQLGFKMDIP